MMKKLLVILGPTATGKTDLGITVAKRLSGELVSCDSRQVYKGLDIGTGKLPGHEVLYEKYERKWVVDGVPIWLYDVVSPDKRYDVWQYVQDAREVIDAITAAGHLPIIVGGTGFYLKGLLEGFVEMDFPVDSQVRDELEGLTIEELLQRLSVLDPSQFTSLNNSERNNKRRLIRRLEKLYTGGQVLPASEEFKGIGKDFDVLKIGLRTDREILYERIDQRVVKRVQAGMITEARTLHASGLSFHRMRELGLEYRFLADYLEGVFPSEKEFMTTLQFKIHQYAKRQLTWFRREEDIEWFDVMSDKFNEKVEEKILNWYNS